VGTQSKKKESSGGKGKTGEASVFKRGEKSSPGKRNLYGSSLVRLGRGCIDVLGQFIGPGRRKPLNIQAEKETKDK